MAHMRAVILFVNMSGWYMAHYVQGSNDDFRTTEVMSHFSNIVPSTSKLSGGSHQKHFLLILSPLLS